MVQPKSILYRIGCALIGLQCSLASARNVCGSLNDVHAGYIQLIVQLLSRLATLAIQGLICQPVHSSSLLPVNNMYGLLQLTVHMCWARMDAQDVLTCMHESI